MQCEWGIKSDKKCVEEAIYIYKNNNSKVERPLCELHKKETEKLIELVENKEGIEIVVIGDSKIKDAILVMNIMGGTGKTIVKTGD